MDYGYVCKRYNSPVKRYCQTLDLKDDPDLIIEYKKHHSKEESWPEIRAGIRAVGILEMDIYIVGTRLFMIVETPVEFDWESAMKKLAGLPRQAEWEKLMDKYQMCEPNSDSSEKWKMMERMFHLYD